MSLLSADHERSTMEQVKDFLKGLTFVGKKITLLLHLFNLRDSLLIDKELLLHLYCAWNPRIIMQSNAAFCHNKNKILYIKRLSKLLKLFTWTYNRWQDKGN